MNIEIKNWDDWFKNCGTLHNDLETYGDLVKKFHVLNNPKNPSGNEVAYQESLKQHKSHFWESLPVIPPWLIKKSAIKFAAGFGAGAITALIWSLVRQVKGDPMAMSRGMLVVLLGLFLGIAVCGIPLGIHLLKRKSIVGRLDALELALIDRLGYVPPKYRNQQATDTFYELYCNYGIVTFNQAVTACDEYLQSNNLPGAYMAYMFDLPYQNAMSQPVTTASSNGMGLYTGGSNQSDDPNLPDDIFSKTYQGVENADEKLAELVGLENVKEQVRQMKNRMDFYNGNSERISGNHMVFLGPPGTGKTTIARIITKILYDFGYIRENKCVEIDGGYMKSPYVGQTTERASAILRYAMGGVLFIDEAYMMMGDKNSSSGSEATGVLLKAMEDNRNDFVVIFAGYEDNVNRLLASNEGFSSRIKYKVYFDNFTVDELMGIFDMQLKAYSQNDAYVLDDGVRETLATHFSKELTVPGFGNARVVRNALDSILDNHADHFMRGEIPEEKKFTITMKDVDAYIKVRQKQMTEDGRNFIATKNLDSSIISLQELKGKTKSGAEDPDAELAKLTGLQVVKDEISQMKAQFDFYDGSIESEGNHMVFLGPPGTGKTTVASIMTGYLYKMGIIRENSYLDVNGDFLRGMYLGHTGKRTEAVVQYSQGMVLFIDEAYLLCSSDGNSDAFGQEAIGVLLDAMEKYRKNFVVIFAGYEKEMSDFLDMNSGLRSRINLEFHFQSYTPHELAQMYKRIAKSNKFKVEKDVWIPMQEYLTTQVTNPKFGNGRFIRQFFEASKKQHIVNFAKKLYGDGDEKKYVITLADVEPLFTDKGAIDYDE